MRALTSLPLLAALGFGSAALAQPAERSVQVELGKSADVDVGFAKGLNCDDTSVVGVSLENKNAESNVLVLKGKKLGSTTCRIGNAQAGATVTVSITVIKPKPKKSSEDDDAPADQAE